MLPKGNFFVNFQKQLPKSGLSIGCRKEKAAMVSDAVQFTLLLSPRSFRFFPLDKGYVGSGNEIDQSQTRLALSSGQSLRLRSFSPSIMPKKGWRPLGSYKDLYTGGRPIY